MVYPAMNDKSAANVDEHGHPNIPFVFPIDTNPEAKDVDGKVELPQIDAAVNAGDKPAITTADQSGKAKKKGPVGRFARTDLRFRGPQSERQHAVVNAALHSWKAYRKYAWGFDELQPLSQTGQNWFDLGLTIVDCKLRIYSSCRLN